MKFAAATNCEEKEAEEQATRVGLNQIDEDGCYALIKLGAKVESEYGYPSQMVALHKANYSILVHKSTTEDNKYYCCLVGYWINGDNFRTSPVKACIKIPGGFDIETNNSFYSLRKI